jgi:hypothetical protein
MLQSRPRKLGGISQQASAESCRMKYCALITFLVVSLTVFADTPNEADYPVQYEVMNANTVGNWMSGNFCTIALRDQAPNGLRFIVQKRGHGACHTPDSGTILHGRREKDEIWLLVRDDGGRLKTERWPIVSTSEAHVHP